eukprot:SAG11_NODE_27384_length_333_cov_0.876068_1_plen_22_part_10
MRRRALGIYLCARSLRYFVVEL